MSSAGTSSGTSFCVAAFGEQPAATPAAAAIFRKLRRGMPPVGESDMGPSLVAGDALGHVRPLQRPLRLLAPVALEAPAHGQRRDLADDVHGLDRAVALAALHPRADVPL